jgi:hypothetical protein
VPTHSGERAIERFADVVVEGHAGDHYTAKVAKWLGGWTLRSQPQARLMHDLNMGGSL